MGWSLYIPGVQSILTPKLRKAGIAAIKVSEYYYGTPPMAYVLQILMVIGIRVDDK